MHHTAIDAPAMTLFTLFLPLEDEWFSMLPRLGFGPRRGRFGKLRRIDSHVRLHLAELDRGSAVGPGNHAPERHPHARDVAVVRVVDLRRDDADGRVDEADLPHEKARLAVEVQLGAGCASCRVLDDLNGLV